MRAVGEYAGIQIVLHSGSFKKLQAQDDFVSEFVVTKQQQNSPFSSMQNYSDWTEMHSIPAYSLAVFAAGVCFVTKTPL